MGAINLLTMYSRRQCSLCQQAKQLLEANNVPFRELIIEEDITRDDVIEKFPGRKMLPIIENDGILIDGYQQLVSYVNQLK